MQLEVQAIRSRVWGVWKEAAEGEQGAGQASRTLSGKRLDEMRQARLKGQR